MQGKTILNNIALLSLATPFLLLSVWARGSMTNVICSKVISKSMKFTT